MTLHGQPTDTPPAQVPSLLARRLMRRAVAGLTMSLTALLFVAGSASAQSPWTVTIVSSTTPLVAGNCSPIRLDVVDAVGGTVPRTPTGVRVGIADFDWSIAPAGKVVGRYAGASAWAACACPGSAGTVATITATYPAQALNDSARVPGVAFSSSISVPVVAANSSGVPIGCEKFKTTTVPAGGGQLPWTVTLTSPVLPIPIGFCSPFQADLRDATGKEPPRAAGRLVSLADFDWSVASGGKVVGAYNGANSWTACACQGATVGAVATISASYPASALAESARVPGVAFQASVTVPVSAASGTYNPPACVGKTVVATAQTAQAALAAPATATSATAPTAPKAPATLAAPAAPAPTGPAIGSGPLMKSGVLTAAPNPDLSRTIPLSGYQASGSFVAVASRVFPLAGFSASGTFVAVASRSFPLNGFTASGTFVVVASRSFPLNGFTASGTFVAVASRAIALAGWTGAGLQKTP